MEKDSVNAIEVRQYQRIVVPDAVGVRVWGREGGGRVFEGTATVIGLGGMFCRTAETRPPGTVLRIRLEFPGVSIEVTEGTVRSANQHGIGVEFTRIAAENRLELAKLLRQLYGHRTKDWASSVYR